jgi:predicted CXXCH cytochrome family protein
MKKIIILGIAAVAMFAATALAGDYHKGADLVCNECHVMHYSQSHDYAGSPHQAPMANGPNEYLLRNKVNELCLSCHDGNAWAPDVLGANTAGGATTRLAGALNWNNGSTLGYLPETGHSLGYTGTTWPGKGGSTQTLPTDGLECVNCHGPHGSMTSYRNLNKADVTYAIGTNELTKWVFETDATHMTGGATGANHYDVSNVDYNEPGGTGSRYADMCKACHADFHGALGGAEVGGVIPSGKTLYEEFHRHPASDVNIGALGGGHSAMRRAASGSTPIDRGFAMKAYRVKVMSQSGFWGAQGTPLYPLQTGQTALPTDMTPSCFSCHKSHGSTKPFGLIYATGGFDFGENGDGIYQDLCKQCHIQGHSW